MQQLMPRARTCRKHVRPTRNLLHDMAARGCGTRLSARVVALLVWRWAVGVCVLLQCRRWRQAWMEMMLGGLPDALMYIAPSSRYWPIKT
jgi:hypothetical protein